MFYFTSITQKVLNTIRLTKKVEIISLKNRTNPSTNQTRPNSSRLDLTQMQHDYIEIQLASIFCILSKLILFRFKRFWIICIFSRGGSVLSSIQPLIHVDIPTTTKASRIRYSSSLDLMRGKHPPRTPLLPRQHNSLLIKRNL